MFVKQENMIPELLLGEKKAVRCVSSSQRFLIKQSFKFFKILLCHFTSCLLSMGKRVLMPSCRGAAAHLLLCKAGAQILKTNMKLRLNAGRQKNIRCKRGVMRCQKRA